MLGEEPSLPIGEGYRFLGALDEINNTKEFSEDDDLCIIFDQCIAVL